MTEGPTARARAPSHHSTGTCQARARRLVCKAGGISPFPHLSHSAWSRGERVGGAGWGCVQLPIRQATGNGVSRSNELKLRGAASSLCNCLDWNFPGPPANSTSILLT